VQFKDDEPKRCPPSSICPKGSSQPRSCSSPFYKADLDKQKCTPTEELIAIIAGCSAGMYTSLL